VALERFYCSEMKIVRLDIVSGPNIDHAADATDFPGDIGEFDAVILQSVPEHVKDIENYLVRQFVYLRLVDIFMSKCHFFKGCMETQAIIGGQHLTGFKCLYIRAILLKSVLVALLSVLLFGFFPI
jgi:hypothetical protein